MDDVQVTDVTNDYIEYNIIGAQAKSAINDSLNIQNKFSTEEVTLYGNGIRFQINAQWSLPCIRLITPKGEEESIVNRLKLVELPEYLYDMLRIEQSIPVLHKEITDKVNPLECGLRHTVSFTKGCYIGQEVIARIDSYNKLQKKLVGYYFDKPLDTDISCGSIIQNEKEIGWTTSHTYSHSYGRYIALGFIKTGAGFDGCMFRSSDGKLTVPVKVTDLPFNQNDMK
jgi:folate-binding protein YgfZ